MINVAILGYGTVGSGVLEVLKMNSNIIDKNAKNHINVKYILDLLDFPGDPFQKLIVHDFETILNDEDVKIVVEVMGGLNPTYDFVKSAILKKKHICTSNKALVAEYGNELMELAKENNVNFLFEASVGGGIPIIRPLKEALTADKISGILGILNGTTNYILTQMSDKNIDFDIALKQAQDLGYAEKDPKSDVEGEDSCRKIAILSSIAYDKFFDYKDILTSGITNITLKDIIYAKKMDMNIKLVAMSKSDDIETLAIVSPFLIKHNNPLYNVNDVFNAILVKGNAVDNVMFYGMGAGKLPTASAVISDIVQIAKNIDGCLDLSWDTKQKCKLSDIKNTKFQKFIRIKGNAKDRISELKNLFNIIDVISLESIEDEFAIIIDFISEYDYENFAKKIDGILSNIRII